MNSDTLKILSAFIGVIGGGIGVIGGVLGFYTFIDNNLLRFKPRLNISERLFFSFDEKTLSSRIRGKPLKSIIFQIEIINGRNKIGRIDDLAVRIYDVSTTQPQPYMLYAESILDRLPINPASLDKDKFNFFSPLSISGRSTKNIVIEFTPEQFNKVYIPTDSYLKMELLFLSPNKKWKTAGVYVPNHFNDYAKDNPLQLIMEYSLLDRTVERSKLERSLKKPASNLYRGVSGKQLRYYLNRPIVATKKIFNYPFKILKLIFAFFILSVRHLIFKNIILPLINKKSKELPRPFFSFPRGNLKSDTAKTLVILKEKLQEIASNINKDADSRAQINITSNSDGFLIQRSKLTIKFYISGDGYITVQDTGGYPQMFLFSMQLYEYPLGIRLWKVNNKLMTIDSACILFMDSLILLAY